MSDEDDPTDEKKTNEKTSPEPDESEARDALARVIEDLRSATLAKVDSARERVSRVRRCADLYLRAVEDDLASDLAERNGLARLGPSTALRAALDLRASVEALPEVAAVERRPAQESVQAVDPTPPRELRKAEVPARSTADAADVAQLCADFSALDFQAMEDALFKTHASELAARARLLQERVGEDDDVGRILRTLTAKAASRNVSGIFGLARHHKGDWAAQVRRSIDERARIAASAASRGASPSRGAGGLTHRLSLPIGIVASDGRKEAEVEDEDDEDDEVEVAPVLDLPNLRALSAEADVLMVGGLVRQEKLATVRRATGLPVEWVALDANIGANATRGLVKRIAQGRVGALLLLQHFMAHKEYLPIVEAAREACVPVAYVARGGIGSMREALSTIEQQLGSTRKTEASGGA